MIDVNKRTRVPIEFEFMVLAGDPNVDEKRRKLNVRRGKLMIILTNKWQKSATCMICMGVFSCKGRLIVQFGDIVDRTLLFPTIFPAIHAGSHLSSWSLSCLNFINPSSHHLLHASFPGRRVVRRHLDGPGALPLRRATPQPGRPRGPLPRPRRRAPGIPPPRPAHAHPAVRRRNPPRRWERELLSVPLRVKRIASVPAPRADENEEEEEGEC